MHNLNNMGARQSMNNKPLANSTVGTRKIAEPPPPPCRDLQHDPAGMIVRDPGTYEHICPSCGKRQIFTIPQVFS